MDPETRQHWEKDLKDLHMVYDYNAHDEEGNPEKWRYEIWFQTEVSVLVMSAEKCVSDTDKRALIGPCRVRDPRRTNGRPGQLPDHQFPMHSPRRAVAVQLA